MPVSETNEIDVFCRTCQKIVIAKVDTSIRHAPTAEMWQDSESGPVIGPALYQVAFCIRCDSPFFVQSYKTEWHGGPDVATFRSVLYPSDTEGRTMPEGLPPAIARTFRSAVACLSAGQFEASSIMARKTVEGLCRELGARTGSLKSKLEGLSKDGNLDPKLVAWADQLRLIGNDAAHELDIAVSHQDAKDTIDFAEALLLYTFTLEAKFRAFTQRRESGRPSGA